MKVTKKALKSATKEVYDKINITFEKTFGVSFAMAQTSVPELNVQVKKSRVELKKEKRNQPRAYKKHIEQQWTGNPKSRNPETRIRNPESKNKAKQSSSNTQKSSLHFLHAKVKRSIKNGFK